MVPNKLKPEAKVAIVIDQPSDQDRIAKKLMSDDIMAHMAGYLASAGILLSQCSMLSVVQQKHSNINRLHDAELMCWEELLRRDLNTIKPNMIITIGELATKVVTGKKKHELYRGSILPCLLSTCKTLVMWNPLHASNPQTPWITAYTGRAEWKPFTSWDCQKAARHKDTPEYLSISPEIIVTKDMNLIRKEFLSYDYVNDPASKLACDIEASYCEMTCIGFAKESTKAYVIPLVHMDGAALAEALQVIDQVLQSKVRKSFQNGNFDVTYMGYYYGIKVKNFFWDTMLAMHSLFPNLPKGLGILGSIFTEEPYWKCLKGDVEVLTPNGWKQLKDIDATERIMSSTLAGTMQWEQAKKIEMPFNGTGCKIKNLRHDCWYAPNHRILSESIHHKGREPRYAENFKTRRNIITAGTYSEGTTDYPAIKLLAAIQADGCVKGNSVVFLLQKENKQKRLLKLCEELNVPVRMWNLSGKRARLECKIYGSVVEEIITRLGSDKDFGSWLLDFNSSTLDKFIEEVIHWDGWITHKGNAYNYSSNNRNNIEWVATIAHCRNKTAHIMKAAGNTCECLKVSIKHQDNISYKPQQHYTEEYYSGQIYCVTVPSSYFLARSNGKIFVTGNSEAKDGEDQKTWLLPYHKVNWPRFFIYNGKDTANLITIWEEQEDLLEARGTRSTFDQEMRICKPLITMELQGMKVNPVIQASMAAKLSKKISRWQLFLDTLLGVEVDSVLVDQDTYDVDTEKERKANTNEKMLNVGSYKQLRHLLYDVLKLPTRTKKGKVTSDGDALLSLIRFDPVLLKSIIILKDLKKQRQFTKIKYNLDDTRVRTTFKPGGTATGRLSSSQSITKIGTNLQQQPKWAREFYIPDSGMILVQADYSKAESWIVAALAKDEKMIAALRGPDFHSANATNLLGRKVTKDDYDDRQLGKKTSHGANYGMSEFLLHKVLIKAGFNFTKREVAKLMQGYFDAYPGIRTNYHNWIKDCLQRDMTLETPFGRKVTFYDSWGTRLFNKAFAWIPQSTIGDMTNTALCQVYENMGHYCDLLIQVHDSLVMQVKPENFTQGFVDDLAGNMIVPLEVKGTKFSVPIDVEAGLDWYHLHDWDDLKAEREQFANTAQFAMAVSNINNRKALKKAEKEHAAEELTDDFLGEDLFVV